MTIGQSRRRGAVRDRSGQAMRESTTTIATAPTERSVADGLWHRHAFDIGDTKSDDRAAAASIRGTGRWVLAAFWLIQLAELGTVALIQGWAFAVARLPERLVFVAAGMVLSLLLVEVAARLEGRAFRVRLIGTFASALSICALLVLIVYEVVRFGPWDGGRVDAVAIVFTGFAWSWFFLAVATAILALSYSAEVRRHGERLVRLEAVARDACVAALRYQINPHFLFNALNSVAGLIGDGEHAVAEDMVENLADFLRATLELDPIDDIALGSELEFQSLYLAVEQARFPHRLRTCIDVPPELASTRVPALITQPLVENAIRHAVARSTGLVTLNVSARAEGDRLIVRIDDDGGTPVGPIVPGTGVGLRNVRERLAARFGDDCSFVAAAVAGGGFRNEIRLPLGTRQ